MKARNAKQTGNGGQASKVSSISTARERRLNYGRLPKPSNGEVAYANAREELAGLTLGEKVAIVTESAAWQLVMVPKLNSLAEERSRRGGGHAYSTEELEAAHLYRLMAGCRTWTAAREKLAGDRSKRCRVALDLDRPRRRVGKNLSHRVSRDGVPSERTMGRHLQLWGYERHALAYRELFAAMVDSHFEEFPEEMAAEMRLVDWDGSAILCHRSSFERKRTLTDRRGRTREVSTPTLTGGGFRPRTQDNAGKDGHGFALHAGITSTGLPLVADITPINSAEGRTVSRLLRGDWQQRISRHVGLTDEEFSVMAFDAAYSGKDVRTAVHDAGYVPNCHPVSHADRERSKANARAHDKMKFAIEGKPGWRANGHREVFCRHGVQATKKLFRRKKGGLAVVGIEGDCKQGCGHVSITAGEWRTAQNPNRFVKLMPGEEDRADWKFGNPLTFNDPVSQTYGTARFGHNEGFHGALVTRFGLLRDKALYADGRQAERDFFAVFSIMHALAMEKRRREPGRASAAPPPAAIGGAPPPLAKAA